MKKLTPFLLLLPHGIFFLIFVIFPIGKSIFMSMTDWGLFEGYMGFVGLENYKILFDLTEYKGQQFWMAMEVTLKFVLLFVPLLTSLSIALAVLLNNKKLKFQSFHFVSMFLPTSLAVTVVVVIWKWIFNGESGLLNYLLSLIDIAPIPWLSDNIGAWVAIIVSTLWWGFAWPVMIILGGLKRIPSFLYESAGIDGANALEKFLYITLPGLKDILMFITITQVLGAFGLFAQSQLMTGGGPGRSTMPVMLLIYGEAFNTSRPRMGVGSAMSIITGAIILAFTFTQYFLYRNKEKD